MNTTFGYQFPAIRGVMARREYYVSMCPMRLIPRIFLFDEEEAALPPELRAQRMLNSARIPEITDYIIANRDDYVFSALTASIDGDVEFTPLADEGDASRIGTLTVSMEAKFIINDGQHRRAAIEAAIREKPELGDETIAIVFFLDRGLERCQQLFADLNRSAIRTSTSIGVLYDHRDLIAKVTRIVVIKSDFLRELVELEATSLGKRSKKLFTLSAIYRATGALLSGLDGSSDKHIDLAIEFWEFLSHVLPEWQEVRDRSLSSGEVRASFIHPHGIALHAMGRAGNSLMKTCPRAWKSRLKAIGELDWRRSNTALWEGRATVNGRLSKANQHVVLASNLLKTTMELSLTADEKSVEAGLKEMQVDYS